MRPWRVRRWGKDWPTKGGGWPETAAHLADKSRNWPCLSILARPENASVADLVARGGSLWGTGFLERGHAGLYIANDTTISANDTHGIRFATWTHDYRDFAKDNGQSLLTRKYTH